MTNTPPRAVLPVSQAFHSRRPQPTAGLGFPSLATGMTVPGGRAMSVRLVTPRGKLGLAPKSAGGAQTSMRQCLPGSLGPGWGEGVTRVTSPGGRGS